MFLLSLQLTAELGNDGKWKVMGNGFTPSISTYQGHSQSAMCRGGQCVASTHVWALESGPGHVGFSSGSTTWEMCSHGKILSSLSPNFLFYKKLHNSQKYWGKLKKIFCKGLGMVTETWWVLRRKCWQLLNLGKRGTELELACDSAGRRTPRRQNIITIMI